nr:truncated transporter-related protein [Tanacetum cinerariifolium]
MVYGVRSNFKKRGLDDCFLCFLFNWNKHKSLLAWGIVKRYGWRLLLGVSLLPSLVALLFYTIVPESPRFMYAKGEASKIVNWGAELNKRQLPEESTSGIKKVEGKGTSEKGAQNERKVVTSEEDEIKDVTLDIDKTVVAGEIQIDEAHHTLKKDDPAGPKIYPTQLRTLGAGVAIVVERIRSIVLPLVGEGMISYDGNKTPAMIMFAFKISVCMVCALLLPIETRGRVLKDDD